MNMDKIKRAAATLLSVIIMTTMIFSQPMAVLAVSTVSGNQVSENTVSEDCVSDNSVQEETEEDRQGRADEENVPSEEPASDAAEEEEANRSTGANTVSDNDTTITVAQVTGVSAISASYSSIEVKYAPVQGSSGYEIYRGESKTSMKLLTDLSKIRTSYTDKRLTTAKKYYYKVRAYVLDGNNKKVYGEFSSIVSAKPTLASPVISKIQVVNYKSAKLTWGKVNGANGYVIYRSTKKSSGYKKIATIKKGKTVTYTDKKCLTGTKYYYKIKAYRTVKGKKKYGGYSKPVSVKTALKKPKLVGALPISVDTAQVTWKKTSGASGYVIYRCETKNGKYKKVATVKGGKTVQTTVAGHENGKTYYYKIRAYRTVKGKKKYSPYSSIKSAKFNRLASADETYSEKAQRIFGLDYYKKYSSKQEAELHMTTITVNVWDFASDGVTKVTKQRKLTVHKNIAETVQQIFKEIYEGKERFPIKNVGGYSWRGDTSNSEHCCGVAIDINWEENYLIDNGVIISGKCYQPGVNPYSIPTDGEVAKIMNKYGFRQGLWGNRCDYMHFSYFGT